MMQEGKEKRSERERRMDTNEEEAGGMKEQLLQKNTVEQKQTI